MDAGTFLLIGRHDLFRARWPDHAKLPETGVRGDRVDRLRLCAKDGFKACGLLPRKPKDLERPATERKGALGGIISIWTGSYLGARLTRRLSGGALRMIVLVFGVAVALKLLI
jgi:hypothetical protein